MNSLHRREFLERSKNAGLGLAAGITILADARSARAYAANEKVTLAMIGAGGRAGNLGPDFATRGDCEMAYICDVNIKSAERLAKKITDIQKKPPKLLQDFRKMLDDKAVQAVVIATPDHWHAPATVWSCQAGKDVYVEKPPTHNCWEGKQMIAAAKKYQRVIQVGTQNRSAAYNRSAKKYLQDGKLGQVYFARIFNMKGMPNAPWAAGSDTPAGLDWDMWNGPAPLGKYNNSYHHHWHHFWRYSSGDIINDGIHQIDLARWVLGVEYPKSVYCSGARYETKGCFESPDTQMVICDFDKMTVNIELTLFTPYILKTSPIIRQSDTMFPYWPQCATRIEIYGTKGVMFLGRHGGGWQVFERPKLQEGVVAAQEKGKFPDPEHKENFVRAVRRLEAPNAPIEEGHKSTLLTHYATISYRLGGQKLLIDPASEEIVGNPEAMKYFKREYRKPWIIEDAV